MGTPIPQHCLRQAWDDTWEGLARKLRFWLPIRKRRIILKYRIPAFRTKLITNSEQIDRIFDHTEYSPSLLASFSGHCWLLQRLLLFFSRRAIPSSFASFTICHSNVLLNYDLRAHRGNSAGKLTSIQYCATRLVKFYHLWTKLRQFYAVAGHNNWYLRNYFYVLQPQLEIITVVLLSVLRR